MPLCPNCSMPIAQTNSPCKGCGKSLTDSERQKLLIEEAPRTKNGLTLGDLNVRLALFLIASAIATSIATSIVRSIAPLGAKPSAVTLLGLGIGVLVAAIVVGFIWRKTSYRVGGANSRTSASEVFGHALIGLGNLAVVIAVPLVFFSSTSEPYAVVGGIAVLVGGWFAIPAWIVGLLLVH